MNPEYEWCLKASADHEATYQLQYALNYIRKVYTTPVPKPGPGPYLGVRILRFTEGGDPA